MDGGIPAQRRRDYARGFLALGLTDEATRELAHLTLVDLEDTDSVDVLVDTAMESRNWPAVVNAAQELTQRRPTEDKGWIAWGYALRELGRITEARDVLLRAEALHGNTCAVLHYNLACYYSLLGVLDEARRRFARATKMHPPFLEGAKEDPDLEALLRADSAGNADSAGGGGGKAG
jgi:Flp pilus assembly protein TadD